MAVSRADKDEEFGQLQTAFREAETAVLVDYRGITVPQVTELRRQIRSSGARYRVVKNSLAKRAAAGTTFEAFSKEFKGPTAVVYTGRDPVALAKALTTFVKTVPTMSIKAAVVQGRAIPVGAVSDLASLPSKPELYAALLSVMQGPARQLVTVLSALTRVLVNVLSAAERKRAEEKSEVGSEKSEV
jgi:large subunit ribosomal protein L10